MDIAFDPAPWHDFYVMAGGAASALTGLVFVAVSLHLTAILRDPWHRGRAGSSLLALMSVVAISGVILAPGQSLNAMGVEVAVVALANLAVNAVGLRRARRPGSGATATLFAGSAAALLTIAAGGSLVLEAGPGLWLLLPGAALAFGSSVWNAWELMVGIATEDGAPG
jgi:hypothetical protein